MATAARSATAFPQIISRVSLSQCVITIFTLLVARWIARGVCRVYLHPLSRFPGPKYVAFTRIPHLSALFTGNFYHWVAKLHDDYGEVVRISPDELSFINPQAWNDVYGHGSKDTRGSRPTKNWIRYGSSVNNTPSILLAHDLDHRRMRSIFNSAFSDRALKEMELVFLKYVDQLVRNIWTSINENPERKLDLTRLYNFTTFDIMGDLAYGESLNMLNNSEYAPWVSHVFGAMKASARLGLVHFYPILRRLFKTVASPYINRKRFEHFKHCIDRVDRRLKRGISTEGGDLWDLVMKQPEGKGLSRAEMDSNSSLIMIAGTETSATGVSGLTYLLLKNPDKMEKLTEELRATFARSEDITMEAVAALPYLNHCMKEGFRLYPPVAGALPRLTQSDGATICGEFIPPGITVAVPHYVTYTSKRNFKDPLEYVPERWIPSNERYASDRKEALQPFSKGSRDCLGKNMAWHEMRLIIAKVLYNFDLTLCPESENWLKQKVYLIWEKHPLIVQVKPYFAA